MTHFRVCVYTLYLNKATYKGTLGISMVYSGSSSQRHDMERYQCLHSAEGLPLPVIFLSLLVFVGGLVSLNQPHFVISVK